MAQVYLGLGTNLGDKEENLREAVVLIAAAGCQVVKRSTFYVSEPWGFASDNMFLNAVVLVETTLSPVDLLAEMQDIERNMGRISKSTAGYSDRPIDIDILLYDDLILELPELMIPHPLLAKRDFVLTPLAELAPDLIHPVFLKSINELKAEQ